MSIKKNRELMVEQIKRLRGELNESINEERLVGKYFFDTRYNEPFVVVYTDGNDIGIEYDSGKSEKVSKNEFDYKVKMGAWNQYKQPRIKRESVNEANNKPKFKVGDMVKYKGAKIPAKVLKVIPTDWENGYVIQWQDNKKKAEVGESSLVLTKESVNESETDGMSKDLIKKIEVVIKKGLGINKLADVSGPAKSRRMGELNYFFKIGKAPYASMYTSTSVIVSKQISSFKGYDDYYKARIELGGFDDDWNEYGRNEYKSEAELLKGIFNMVRKEKDKLTYDGKVVHESVNETSPRAKSSMLLQAKGNTHFEGVKLTDRQRKRLLGIYKMLNQSGQYTFDKTPISKLKSVYSEFL